MGLSLSSLKLMASVLNAQPPRARGAANAVTSMMVKNGTSIHRPSAMASRRWKMSWWASKTCARSMLRPFAMMPPSCSTM